MENEIVASEEVTPQHYEVAMYLEDGRRILIKFNPAFSFTDNPIASAEYARDENGDIQIKP